MITFDAGVRIERPIEEVFARGWSNRSDHERFQFFTQSWMGLSA